MHTVYRMRSLGTDDVTWSAGMFVTFTREVCKNGYTDRDAFWVLTRVGQRTMCDGVVILTQFKGLSGPLKTLGVSAAALYAAKN